jgi:hypothetical protein
VPDPPLLHAASVIPTALTPTTAANRRHRAVLLLCLFMWVSFWR